MSWQDDTGVHEGWAAAEFAGELWSVGSHGGPDGGALVRTFAPGPLRNQHEGAPVVVDGRTVIGWRGLCECGWRGPLWKRVDDPADADPRAHRVYVPDVGRYGVEPEDLEDAIGDEWRAHLEPQTITAVREAAGQARAAEARLDAAVRAARADGRSWEAIGAAVGITRQSAHTRWAKHETAGGR